MVAERVSGLGGDDDRVGEQQSACGVRPLTAAVSRSPMVRDACWAAVVVIRLAREEPRLPLAGLVSTVIPGRVVACVVVSAVTESVKSAGMTRAPYTLPESSSSWARARDSCRQSAASLEVSEVMAAAIWVPRFWLCPAGGLPVSPLTSAIGRSCRSRCGLTTPPM